MVRPDGSLAHLLLCLEPPAVVVPAASGTGRFSHQPDQSPAHRCWDSEQRADHQRSCHDRANKGLGSSRGWNSSGMFNPNVSSAGGGLPNAPDNWYCCHGILSSNSSENPDFHDWNLAFVGYCDGSSFSGNRDLPLHGLHYRGRANLDAVLDRLLLPRRSPHMSLADATEVLISGGSAGGLAVYLHADHIAARLPSSASVSKSPRAQLTKTVAQLTQAPRATVLLRSGVSPTAVSSWSTARWAGLATRGRCSRGASLRCGTHRVE